MWLGVFCVYTIVLAQITWVSCEQSVWMWECENYECVKTMVDRQKDRWFSLEECRMFCERYGVLWPRPTEDMDLGNFLSKINIADIKFDILRKGKSDELLNAAIERFKNIVFKVVPKGVQVKPGKAFEVKLICENPDIREFSLDMDESYNLNVAPKEGTKLVATINANSFFGLRHGLETLTQLILFDENTNHVLVVRDVKINDKPAYPYRGLLLDTARNYFSVDSIKKLIDTMAMVKLNTFHWHITDTQSFPFVSEKRPELSKNGAYSPTKVYTKSAIREVVEYAAARGVRVVPELDAPAHVGEGWPEHLTTCFKADPWIEYCVEPPCGQFNVANDELYDYLEDLYTEMAETFQPDMFHMGGDEVSERCWNSSTEIRNFMKKNEWNGKKGFLDLWGDFQIKAQQKAYKAFGKVPLILWTSKLTDFAHIANYVKPEEYIIQLWTTGHDSQLMGLLKKGYKIIISNSDGLYLDCGFGSWLHKGPSWCTYSNWQTVYDNSLVNRTDLMYQVLGAEATLWSEQSDEHNMETRIWPRAAALAERLWSNPHSSYKHAVNRMHSIRDRLVRMGVQADSLQPEWCSQNGGHC